MPALSALPERTLRTLAERAGIASAWTDAFGTPRRVAPDTLRALLAALGIEDDAALADTPALAPLLPVDAARPVLEDLPPTLRRIRRVRVLLEHGGIRDARLVPEGDGSRLDAVLPPGYHTLDFGAAQTVLAAAPARCFGPADALGDPHARAFGVAAQLYGLRAAPDRGLGDFGAAADLARTAADFGAHAVALSPVHALFAAEPEKYSPYSPSHRGFYNVLHATPAALADSADVARCARAAGLTREFEQLRRAPALDWTRVASARLALFEALFQRFDAGTLGAAADFAAFRAAGGSALRVHAEFEALSEYRVRTHGSVARMPATLADANASGARAFAHTHGARIAFHAWLQWLAARSLAAAQAQARSAGMAIGLITDLAVGVDPAGSECWSQPDIMLRGARIGAPPDQLNAVGQNWGLTTFSPFALKPSGYAAFLDVLRACLRHAGGVRIDHVMSLLRLWLIPAGAEATAGAYLRYPSTDLLRLIALESWRHRAIVIGEDLGTVPPECRRQLARAGLLGLDVLPFMRDGDDFLPPERWRARAVAMTSTHDLPPVAGWWRGRDLDWRSRLHLFGASDERSERRERRRQREQLGRRLQPKAARAARAIALPARVDAAIDYVAASPSPLALIPLEDLLGADEAPNLPGTVAEHPNWQRRYPADAADLFARPAVQRRAARLRALRGKTR